MPLTYDPRFSLAEGELLKVQRLASKIREKAAGGTDLSDALSSLAEATQKIIDVLRDWEAKS